MNSSSSTTFAFQSDELLADDEEFGLEGGRSLPDSFSIPSPLPSAAARKRHQSSLPDSDPDSKLHFSLEHALGDDSDFTPAGTFSARLKSSHHGGQTLTKLRFSRNSFSDADKDSFLKLLKDDGFYRIRLPSNVLSPPGRDYIISSVKARCIPRESMDEHFTIHMEGVNIVAVNYGSVGHCQYPRQFKTPTKWSFSSHTILKNSEQAPRAPAFVEEIFGGQEGEVEGVKTPERSFWAKYWMYLIPLGLIVMNAVTQAMNMPEEQAPGQSTSQTQQPMGAIQRGQSSAVRRR